MAAPAIVWRNPHSISRRRIWSRAKSDSSRSLYLVVEAASAKQSEWKGLPNLEIIRGGTTASARETRRDLRLPSGT
jgi:hypothetical protein